MFNGFHYMGESINSIKSLRTKTFHRNGVEYQVYFNPQRVWDEVIIYQINPNRKFFKKREVARYLELVLRAEATYLNGLDANSESFMYDLANFALDSYLKNMEANEKAAELKSRQFEYLQRGE